MAQPSSTSPGGGARGGKRGRKIAGLAAAAVVLVLAAIGMWQVFSGLLADPPPREGTVEAFRLDGETAAPADLKIATGRGETKTLGDYRGQVVLLNLWATWCAPCVKEMPELDALQARLGGSDFVVLPLSLDRQGLAKVEAFYNEHDLEHLGRYADKEMAAMRALGPESLPTTYVIKRDGTIAGKLVGIADWSSADARALIQHYL